MNNSRIEWTDATWNPIRGCTRVSEGCRNCYAERMAHRFSGEGQPYEGLTQLVNGRPAWTGKVTLVEEHLLDPLKWKPVKEMSVTNHAGVDVTKRRTRPRRVFVNSTGDLFHPQVPDDWIAKIAAVMVLANQHSYQVLTKRPERMQPLLSSEGFWALVSAAVEELTEDRWIYETPLPNLHLGVSVEDQATADERIPLLLQTPAAVRFVSAEPLLGAARFGGRDPEGVAARIDWVICGGESGTHARPMHPDWVRGLRDQCTAAGAPFFFKQWGEWGEVERRNDLPGRPWMVRDNDLLLKVDGAVDLYEEVGGIGHATPMRRVGKKAAGALLDGREWREFPRLHE